MLGYVTQVTFVMAQPPPASAGSELPWRLVPEHSGGGLLLDTGSHVIDLIEYLVGEPLVNVTVSCTLHTPIEWRAWPVSVHDVMIWTGLSWKSRHALVRRGRQRRNDVRIPELWCEGSRNMELCGCSQARRANYNMVLTTVSRKLVASIVCSL
eukprot:SAG31_NODE_793_length_12044_cov_12.886229_4_plen_153_part_00